MHTVSETNYYVSRAEKLLTTSERDEVIDLLACDPLAGDLIQGTGGIRKIRFAKEGRGKSGGVRVLYYFYNENAPIFLLEIFGKNEKANLTKAERNTLAQGVIRLKKGLRT